MNELFLEFKFASSIYQLPSVSKSLVDVAHICIYLKFNEPEKYVLKKEPQQIINGFLQTRKRIIPIVSIICSAVTVHIAVL